MRRFAALYAALDASTATEARLVALQRYLAEADATDAAWALYLLAGGRPRPTVPTATLRSAATAAAGIPDWLFEASCQAAGDLAETIAHLLPPPRRRSTLGLAVWIEQRLLPLRDATPAEQAQRLCEWWDELVPDERFVLVKLIGGGFRAGVGKPLLQAALARHAGLDVHVIAQRMVGWTDARTRPSAERLRALLAPEDTAAPPAGRPLPFCPAQALPPGTPDLPVRLGAPADWQAEWQYDGLRAQIVRRAGGVWLWSRDEELITERFPEVVAAARALPDGTVLDGELLVWQGGGPAPFDQLQRRIGRQTPSRKLLAELPVRFVAFDLLSLCGEDGRARPQHQRRDRLEALLADSPLDGPLRLSPRLRGGTWAELDALRADSRRRGAEGLMLKHRDAAYGSGPSDGAWWTWQVDPLTLDGVLIYAQAGPGRRAGLYTDCTFAVWSRPPAGAEEADAVVAAIARREPPPPGALQLVAVAKVGAGLDDEAFAAVDRTIRATTLQKFGPVRSLRPSLVCELAFDGIQRSRRHKSGIALRCPRLRRLRPDKPLHEADTLDRLIALLA